MMIDTRENVFVPFSSKKEVLEGLQSLKASMERETEAEFFNKWLNHTNGCLTVNVKKTLSSSIYGFFFKKTP